MEVQTGVMFRKETVRFNTDLSRRLLLAGLLVHLLLYKPPPALHWALVRLCPRSGHSKPLPCTGTTLRATVGTRRTGACVVHPEVEEDVCADTGKVDAGFQGTSSGEVVREQRLAGERSPGDLGEGPPAGRGRCQSLSQEHMCCVSDAQERADGGLVGRKAVKQ